MTVKRILVVFVILLVLPGTNTLSENSFPHFEIETPHFIVCSQEGNEVFAREAAGLAESIYDNAITFMKYAPEEKTRITLYPSERTFAFVGAYDEGVVLNYACPFSTESGGRDYLDRKRQIGHEFSHYLLFERAESMAHFWLVEGLAMYSSDTGYYKTQAEAAITYLNETNRLPGSLEEIHKHSFSYVLSYSVVQFMINTYSEESFQTFLDELVLWDPLKTSTENVTKAIQNGVDVPVKEFEEAWILYLEEVVQDFKEFDASCIIDTEGSKAPSSWHNNKILFVSDVNRNLDIYCMDTDGTSVQRLTHNSSSDFDPKFSPDGEKIAFTSRRDKYANIYCMNADGTSVHQLTYEKTIDAMGSWSPDGETIAFTSSRSGNYDIFTMNADGSAIIQLTHHPGSDGWPVFSPDGQKILFVSDRGGTYDLYVMNSDGTGVEQLSDTPEYENYPVYSPDGGKIVFVSRSGKGAELCIMNSDGTKRRTIAPQPWVLDRTLVFLYGLPVYSPNGGEVAFTCGTQIFRICVEDDDFVYRVLAVIVIIIMCFIFLKYLKKTKF